MKIEDKSKSDKWVKAFMKTESEWVEEVERLKAQIKRLKKRNKSLSENSSNLSSLVYGR